MNKATPERWQQFYVAVGKVTRAWVDLEGVLSMAFCALLRIDQFRGRIVWSNMPNFRARRSLLETLAITYLEDPLLAEFKAQLNRAKRLAEQRNRLAHSSGGVDSETGHPFFLKDQPDNNLGFKFFDIRRLDMSSIEKLSDDIYKLSRDVGNTLNRLIDEAHERPRDGRIDSDDQNR